MAVEAVVSYIEEYDLELAFVGALYRGSWISLRSKQSLPLLILATS